MYENVIILSQIILSVVVAINLKLTFNLLNLIRNPQSFQSQEITPPIDKPLPIIEGDHILNNRKHPIQSNDQPMVLLFLSSKCPKCREKLEEIERLMPEIKRNSIDLWFITMESKRRIKQFLSKDEYHYRIIRTGKKDYKKFNPSLSSPFYLFVDHLNILQAGGEIGDDNWQSFSQQLLS